MARQREADAQRPTGQPTANLARDRMKRLLRDLEAQGVRFRLSGPGLRVEGLGPSDWLDQWVDRNGRLVRRVLATRDDDDAAEDESS